MATQAVSFDDFSVELSQPIEDRPHIILIESSDGRCAVLGDGIEPVVVLDTAN